MTKSLKLQVESILRIVFPHDTIDIVYGNRRRLHLVVVSRQFDRMNDTERITYLWKILKKAKLTKKQIDRISLIITRSPEELKHR